MCTEIKCIIIIIFKILYGFIFHDFKTLNKIDRSVEKKINWKLLNKRQSTTNKLQVAKCLITSQQITMLFIRGAKDVQ